MKPKVIKSEEEHVAALSRLSDLMDLDPGPGSDEESELEILAVLIEDYERRMVPPPSPDPIEAILFRMDQMKLKQRDLVPFLGSLPRVSEVLSRKRTLSLRMIRQLSSGLGIPADSLIGSQDDKAFLVREESGIDYARFPLREMFTRGCFRAARTSLSRANVKEYAEELIRPLMEEFLPENQNPAFLRSPLHQRGSRSMDPYALQAWRICVTRSARSLSLPRAFDKEVITPTWLNALVRLSAFDDGPRLAQEYLIRHGIAFVIEPHFPGTYLDGAALLDGPRPIIGLTLRHDRLDNFWFALMHELAHVHMHLDQNNPFFVDDLDRVAADRVEEEADLWSKNALIPEASWETISSQPKHTADEVRSFAHQLGVHPAIVAGRIRHEASNYKLMTNLVGHGKVRQMFEAN